MDTMNLSSLIVSDRGKILLNIIDQGSKFAYSYFVQAKSAAEILTCLEMWRLSEPNAKILHSDNRTEFRNTDVRQWSESEKIIQRFNRPNTPRDAGAIEAFNRTIKEMLITMKLTFPTKSMEFLLPLAISVYNTEREHTSTCFIPIKHFISLDQTMTMQKLH